MLAIIEDIDARMKMMRGELNIATDLLPDTYNALSKQPGISATLGFDNKLQGLWFHCWSGPLKTLC